MTDFYVKPDRRNIPEVWDGGTDSYWALPIVTRDDFPLTEAGDALWAKLTSDMPTREKDSQDDRNDY